MKLLRRLWVLALFPLVACSRPIEPSASSPSVEEPAVRPGGPALKPGSNQMLRAPLTVADGLEVIVSDVIIPANAQVPRHYHPGEEFVYVLEGSAVHIQAGQPQRVVEAGEAFVIPPGIEHAPRAGENGARAVVFRVHVEGEPERTLVPEQTGE